jgi:hypothetical protein
MPTLLPRGRREPSQVMRPAGTRVGGRRAGLVAAAGLPQPEHGAVEPDQPWSGLFRCSTGSCVSTPSEEDHRRAESGCRCSACEGARARRQPDPVAGLDQTEVLRVDADAMPAVGVPECAVVEQSGPAGGPCRSPNPLARRSALPRLGGCGRHVGLVTSLIAVGRSESPRLKRCAHLLLISDGRLCSQECVDRPLRTSPHPCPRPANRPGLDHRLPIDPPEDRTQAWAPDAPRPRGPPRPRPRHQPGRLGLPAARRRGQPRPPGRPRATPHQHRMGRDRLTTTNQPRHPLAHTHQAPRPAGQRFR